jgi:NAD(P)-dependent dehydrogenase (short-subunit alcohol dehydrogenase family)
VTEPRGEQNGRVAAVTGGASGIGRGAALRLAQDGFAVAVLDWNGEGAEDVATSIRQSGGRSVGVQVDVSRPEEVERAFEASERELGPLYALVSSAGILNIAPPLELTYEAWRRVLDINLTGTFLAAQAAARRMAAAGQGGRIVNVASVHSQAPGRGLAHYDASKGGIWMLTRNLALELAPHGITVNAVGPGLVRTNLGGGSDEAYLAQVIPTIPLGRAGQPEDIAGPIAFLCSDEASYMTGSMLFIDGGMLLTAHT